MSLPGSLKAASIGFASLLPILLVCLVVDPALSQTLLRDVNTLRLGPYPRHILSTGDQVFVIGMDLNNREQFWVTDAEATELRRIESPDEAGIYINSFLGTVNGRVLFSTSYSPDIWVSDGTESGTFKLKGGSVFDHVVEGKRVGEYFYFNVGQDALWVTDGTVDGTRHIYDINARDMEATDAALYFRSPRAPGVDSTDVWKLEAGADQPVLVATHDSVVRIEGASDSHVLFMKCGEDYCLDAWITDGTQVGTSRLDSAGRFVQYVAGGRSNLYYRVFDDLDGSGEAKLWVLNGNSAERIGPLTEQNAPRSLGSVVVDGHDDLYFRYDDGVTGEELWTTDGTVAGTRRVSDIRPGTQGSRPSDLAHSGGLVYFSANDGVSGYELWVTDGADAGTRLVRDMTPGRDGTSIVSMTATSAGVVFRGAAGGLSSTFWFSGGTAAETRPVLEVIGDAPTASSAPSRPIVVGDRAFWGANDGVHGRELWVSDGTAEGTRLAADLIDGSASSNARPFASVGELLFVQTHKGLYAYDTRADIIGSRLDYLGDVLDSRNVVRLDGAIAFSARRRGQSHEVWYSNGTPGGTYPMTDIQPDDYGSDLAVTIPGATGDHVISFLYDGTTTNLYGTPLEGGASTLLANDVYWKETGGINLDKDRLIVACSDEKYCVTDGTYAGTVPIADTVFVVSPGPWQRLQEASPQYVVMEGLVYFMGYTHDRNDLWVTDGTRMGTRMVKKLGFGGSYYEPNYFTVANDRIFFTVQTEEEDNELWVSDGTTDGTHVVDLYPGGRSGAPVVLGAIEDRVLISGGQTREPEHGELWITDGTLPGTLLAAEIDASELTSNPRFAVEFGDLILLAADHSDYGLEMWAVERSSLPSISVSTERELSSGIGLDDVYPNPASGPVTIRYSAPAYESVRFRLYDVLGRRVAMQQTGRASGAEQEVTLDTSRLAPGVYVIEMIGETVREISTVIVAR